MHLLNGLGASEELGPFASGSTPPVAGRAGGTGLLGLSSTWARWRLQTFSSMATAAARPSSRGHEKA